jgi:hypothetical protein
VFKQLRLAALFVGSLAVGAIVVVTPVSAAPLSPTADTPDPVVVGPSAGTSSAGASSFGTYLGTFDQAGEGQGQGVPSTLPAPPDGADGVVAGPVGIVNGSKYTLDGPEGSSLTIATTSSTTYVNADGSSASAASVKAGTFVTAEGTLSNQGKTLTAERITIGSPQQGQGLQRGLAIQVRHTTGGEGTRPPGGEPVAGIGGPVSAVNGSKYTIGGPDGSSMTVTATSNTTYANADGSSADATAVKAGVFIMAVGAPSNDGKEITAQRIVIGKPDGGFHIAPGR